MTRRWGVLAEFDGEQALVAAARRTRAAGHRRLDACTPYPVEGLAEALGLRRPRPVALAALLGGLAGAAGGYALQAYVMAVDYPLNVGGRPLHSWPAFVPVTFELMVLAASLSATVALFVGNRLPQPHHPLFGAPGFERASQGGFFLAVEVSGATAVAEETRALLLRLGAREVVDVDEEG